MHDPTQVNRQGPDRGEQYRSVILVRDDAQREAAERSRDRAQGAFPPADRDVDRGPRALLPGRGLPPAVLRGERPRAVLPRLPRRRGGAARDRGGSAPVADHLVRGIAHRLAPRRAAAAERPSVATALRRVVVRDRHGAGDPHRPVGFQRERRAALPGSGTSHRNGPGSGPVGARAPRSTRTARRAVAERHRPRPPAAADRVDARRSRPARVRQRSPSCTSRPSGRAVDEHRAAAAPRGSTPRSSCIGNPTTLCEPSQNGLFSRVAAPAERLPVPDLVRRPVGGHDRHAAAHPERTVGDDRDRRRVGRARPPSPSGSRVTIRPDGHRRTIARTRSATSGSAVRSSIVPHVLEPVAAVAGVACTAGGRRRA